jgi:hypothetical protein
MLEIPNQNCIKSNNNSIISSFFLGTIMFNDDISTFIATCTVSIKDKDLAINKEFSSLGQTELKKERYPPRVRVKLLIN